jgi:hypothetical protein
MKPDSKSPEASAARYRFRDRYKLLLVMAALVMGVVFILPIVSKPAVEPPAEVQFGSPFSVGVQISNQNVTPLTDVVYTCEVANLTLADGSTAGNVKIVTRGSIRKIRGRQGVPARCEMAYIANAPLKAAEYQLTLKYRAYPWPQLRTAVYRIAAKLDGQGQVTGWKSD